MLVLKLVVMLIAHNLVLKKTIEQSCTSVHFHLHEPPSFARAKQAGREISWLLDGFIKAGKFGSIHEQPRPDLALTSPLGERGGASRNFRPVDTRDRSPLLLTLLLLLLSASPSHGTREDPRERDRQRHSYTFRSVKVDDPRRPSVSFHTLSLAIRRQEAGQWIKSPVTPSGTWGLSAARFAEERTEVGQSFVRGEI